MADKENEKRKLRAELEKAKKQRDILEQKMPTLDSNIDELQVMLEKMSREIDKETKKRENAVREKEQACQKLLVFEEVYDELNIDDPSQFRVDFEALQNELAELRQ